MSHVIPIKHFVAYLRYNNNLNSYFYDQIDNPPDFDDRQALVDFTTDGTAVFYAHAHGLDETMAYFKALHKELREEFGYGLSIALAPDSDCSYDSEMLRFCQEMKEEDPDIITIIQGQITNFVDEGEFPEGITSMTAWREEPFRSADLATQRTEFDYSGLNVKLKPGLDYVVTSMGSDVPPTRIILDTLGIDRSAIPKTDYRNKIHVEGDTEALTRIQQIANEALDKTIMSPSMRDRYSLDPRV